MANEIKIKTGRELIFRSSVYSPTAINDLTSGSPVTVDLTLDEGGTGLSAASAVNSDKVDLLTPRASRYTVIAAFEFFAAIVAGETLVLYWSPSFNSVASDGNPGKPDGVDGAWTGDGGGTVAQTTPQLQRIGSFVCTDLQGVQIAEVSTNFSPNAQYGQLIVVNNTGTLVCGTDDIESAVLMVEILDEIQ